MPPEVIDLLSSPIALRGPPRKSSPVAQRHETKQTTPIQDHGFVDLTDKIVHHVAKHQSVPRGSSPPPSHGGFMRNSMQAITASFLSDDFDTTGDLDGRASHDFSDRRASKRPRLSPDIDFPSPPNLVPDASQTSADLPAIRTSLHPVSPKRLNSISNLDPIELSSSPISKNTVPAARTSSLLDSDLFVSPSPTGRRHLRKGSNDATARSARDPSVTIGHQQPQRQPPEPSRAWDPISSSAPLPSLGNQQDDPAPSRLQHSVSEVINIDTSDEEEDSSDLSSDEFPDVSKIKPSRGRNAVHRPTAATAATATTTKVRKRVAPAAPKKTAEEKAREKEAREAERERKRKEKEQAKERAKQQRALEKEAAAALAEVNKVRVDKKTSTPEMIVHLPSDLAHATRLQAETLLKDLDVQCEESRGPPLDGVLRWSRKVRARYDEELERWEPIPMQIELEKHAMVLLSAASFVGLVLGGPGADIDSHVRKTRLELPGHTLIYLIEGLTPWMRKNRSIRNRQFVSAVRDGLAQDASSSSSSSGPVAPANARQQQQQQQSQRPSSRQKKTNARGARQASYVDEDRIEDALLDLQILHGALIHHTATALETAQQIAVFTQHISTIPYRRPRDDANASSAAFCMEAGQVRTGDGPADTYLRMLQEVSRVTAPVAHGVASEFGSVSELIRRLEHGGPLALQDVRKCANKDGAFSDRRVGPALSRRLHKVFTGTDERSMDI